MGKFCFGPPLPRPTLPYRQFGSSVELFETLGSGIGLTKGNFKENGREKPVLPDTSALELHHHLPNSTLLDDAHRDWDSHDYDYGRAGNPADGSTSRAWDTRRLRGLRDVQRPFVEEDRPQGLQLMWCHLIFLRP